MVLYKHMSNQINFIVTADEEGFTASAVNAFIVTQGDSLDELLANIKEATSMYFEEDKTIKSPFFNLMYSDNVYA
jgi:predicted RNase H-like HicB family nuclease